MFSAQSDTLLQCLNRANSGIERSNVRPILGNFLLSMKDQKLEVIGSNGDLLIKETLEVKPGKGIEEFRVCVHAHKLMQTLRYAAPLDEAVFEIEDDKAHMRVGNSEYKLLTLQAAEYPMRDDTDNVLAVTVSVDAPRFKRLLHHVAFAMAAGNHRYYLNGMFWSIKEGKLTAVATNGHRMALDSIAVETEAEPCEVIIPRQAIDVLHSLLGDAEGAVKVELFSSEEGRDPSKARMSFGATVIDTQVIAAKYPDHERVVPKANPNLVVLSREDFRTALRRVSAISDDRDYVVKADFGEATLALMCDNRSVETAMDEVSLTSHEGDPIVARFGGSYLEDVLGTLEQDEIVIALKDPDSGVLIVPAEEDPTFKYVIMPVRS